MELATRYALRATRCALHSDNHGESVHEACVSCGTHATPQTPRHRRIQMGWFRAVAALGTQGRARSASSGVGRAQRRPVSTPLRLGRGAQDSADQGSRCLSEASLARPRSTAGCPERSAGTQTAGRLFLLTSFGEAKEVSAPPGAHPGLEPQQNQKAINSIAICPGK